MSKGTSQIVVTLRKVSSGHRVVAFSMEDLNHAYSIARILVRSQEYGKCYAVACSWDGNTLFNVQPEQVHQVPAPYQAPVPSHYPHPQMMAAPYPGLPAYPQQPAPMAPQPGNPYGPPPGYRAVPAYVEVEDGYAVEPAPVQRALPALPWKGGR